MVPLISVLMPVRNAAVTVARAVESIRVQTWPDWELLAVDDGSTDGTREWLRAAAGADRRIRLLERPPEGLVAALNAGLAAARGRLIARMDADDESHPKRLAAQAAFLAANPDLGVVGCLVDFGGDRRAQAGYALHVDWVNSLLTPEAIALNRFVESPFAHPSVMFRRELVGRLGGYREGDFPEDYELWLRWLDAGVRMAKVPRMLLTWHDPPARLSRTDPRYDPEAFFRLKAFWLARWLRANIGAPRKILVWGAGRPTRKRAAWLKEQGVRITGYIDIDPKKTGRPIGGRQVLAVDGLPPPGEVFVLGYVASRGARELIRGHLAARGYAEGGDFLMCA
ncbi:MAG: glycosyltransferase [Opitutaceae bacterium]|nr:glycosyltransferase [Opitutaceae bacterium]